MAISLPLSEMSAPSYEAVKNYDTREIPKEAAKAAMWAVAGACALVAAFVLPLVGPAIFHTTFHWQMSLAYRKVLGCLILLCSVGGVLGGTALGMFGTATVSNRIESHLGQFMRLRSYIPENKLLENLSAREVQQVLEKKGINAYGIPGIVQDFDRLLELKPLIAALNAKEKVCEKLEQEIAQKAEAPKKWFQVLALDASRRCYIEAKLEAAFIYSRFTALDKTRRFKETSNCENLFYSYAPEPIFAPSSHLSKLYEQLRPRSLAELSRRFL